MVRVMLVNIVFTHDVVFDCVRIKSVAEQDACVMQITYASLSIPPATFIMSKELAESCT